MNVSELIEKLKKMPQEAEISILYDLGCENPIDHVWLSRSGKVHVTDEHQWFHDKNYWPYGEEANYRSGFDSIEEDWRPDLSNKI